jgi:hypothetical protein
MVRRFYCKYKRITYEVGVLMRLDELIQLKRIMEDLEGIPHRANVILMLFTRMQGRI